MIIFKTLSNRIGLLFLGLFLVLQCISFSISGYLVFLPIIKNSVDDFASLIILTAQTASSLSESQFSEFNQKIEKEHHLKINLQVLNNQAQQSYLPYVILLEKALSRKTNQNIVIKSCNNNSVEYSVEIPVGGKTVFITFRRERIGTSPVAAMVSVLFVTFSISMAGAWWVALFVKRRLNLFTSATAELATGIRPEPLNEDGPEEIALLARNFNCMAKQVTELIEDRAIMLAGISHDLRTPIARMVLALELLKETKDFSLTEKISVYLEDMNKLISRFLLFVKTQKKETLQLVCLAALLDEWIKEYDDQGKKVIRKGLSAFRLAVPVLDLKRVVSNLIDNAILYSDNGLVEIELYQIDQHVIVDIKDRGPGIAGQIKPLVFRPFFRIDASRHTDSGNSGLGLSIVQGIAKSHQWQIELLDRVDGGTVARVGLPASKITVTL